MGDCYSKVHSFEAGLSTSQGFHLASLAPGTRLLRGRAVDI
jgi:hypothetical protein